MTSRAPLRFLLFSGGSAAMSALLTAATLRCRHRGVQRRLTTHSRPAALRLHPMPLSGPRDSTIAVVGDGFSSLIIYATAVYLGFRPEEITIYGPADSPVKTYQQYAFNLGQTVLRSESESHFLPADWPTFAQLDAWSHRSLRPLRRSVARRYNPGVSEILTEATVVARRLSWESARVPKRVGWLQRQAGPPPH